MRLCNVHHDCSRTPPACACRFVMACTRTLIFILTIIVVQKKRTTTNGAAATTKVFLLTIKQYTIINTTGDNNEKSTLLFTLLQCFALQEVSKRLASYIIHYGNHRKRRERLSMKSSRQMGISGNCLGKEKLLCAFKLSEKEVQKFQFLWR